MNFCKLLHNSVEISYELDISHGSVCKILVSQLKFHIICAQWMPRLLMEENKGKCFNNTLKFLQYYQREENELLDKIVTRDESWIHHFSP